MGAERTREEDEVITDVFPSFEFLVLDMCLAGTLFISRLAQLVGRNFWMLFDSMRLKIDHAFVIKLKK